MKSNKGFSLVELLGVLMVLGLVSLIIVPTALNVIDRGNKDAFSSSVQSVIEAAQAYQATTLEANEELQGGVELSDLLSDKKIELKNPEKFVGGKVYASDKGTITVAAITDGTYCASGTKNNLTITNYDSKTGKC